MGKKLKLSSYTEADVCVDCGHLRYARGFFGPFSREHLLSDCCPKCGSTNGTKKAVVQVMYGEHGGFGMPYRFPIANFYLLGEEPTEEEFPSKKNTSNGTSIDWFCAFCLGTPVLMFLFMVYMFSK